MNGTDLNVVSQIPYSDSYLFSVIFDVPPTDATIEIDGVTYYGNEDFTLPGTYHFVVNNLFSGYKELYIIKTRTESFGSVRVFYGRKEFFLIRFFKCMLSSVFFRLFVNNSFPF